MCKLDLPQALRCRRNVIFGNIEKIAEFHSNYFLQDLENCNGNPLLVAKAFQSHVSEVSFQCCQVYFQIWCIDVLNYYDFFFL